MTDHDELWLSMCIAAFIVLCLWLAVDCQQETARCQSRGGHFVRVYRDRLCVSADGRVLE